MRNYLAVLAALMLAYPLYGQQGGISTYQFLNLPYSCRVAALGGKLVASDKPDLSLVGQNPSVLDSSLHQTLHLYYTRYYAGISFASASYAYALNPKNSLAVGFSAVSYGQFDEADETGNITGSFSGTDFALTVSYSYTIDSFYSIGVNLKPVYSHLERYTSFGLSADIGAQYTSHNRLFAAGVALKNVGMMIKPYSPGNRERLPFEIIAGVSKKLAHAPFRLVFTFHQLQNLNLYYSPPTSTNQLNVEDPAKPNLAERFGREFMSHFITGVEFTPTRNFSLRVGYNYQRRNELKVQERVSTVGFSWGFAFRVSGFDISYSRATYHLTGSTNHFAITTNLQRWL